MIWRIPKIWEGGDVWIIGGGSSMPKQFGVPDELIQKVFEGTVPPSVYSNYMKRIHKKHVIGINMAYKIGDWMDIIFFGDKGFFLTHEADLAVYPGLKVSCHHVAGNRPWVKLVGRDKKRPKGISSHPAMVSWNYNSGAAAISLAVHTGAKRIILLGFDMKLSNTHKQHWHNSYGRGEITTKRPHTLPFDRHLRGFVEIAKDARRLGIEILNANPESAISDFKKVTVNEILQ